SGASTPRYTCSARPTGGCPLEEPASSASGYRTPKDTTIPAQRERPGHRMPSRAHAGSPGLITSMMRRPLTHPDDSLVNTGLLPPPASRWTPRGRSPPLTPNRRSISAMRSKPVILVALLLAAFLVNLDTTLVNVGLPAMVRQLHATTTQLQWVVDAYNLV